MRRFLHNISPDRREALRVIKKKQNAKKVSPGVVYYVQYGMITIMARRTGTRRIGAACSVQRRG